MKIRPLHDRVIIRRMEEERTSPGGIVIPDSATEKPIKGEVIAVGKGKITDSGDIRALDLKAGDKVGVRGPFGTHFPVDEAKGKDILFVAGGIGLVPLRSFIQFVLDHRNDYGEVTILFGARNPSERLFLDELEQWATRGDIRYLDTVDRPDPNWNGHVGVITTLFPKIEVDPSRTYCIVVGPPVMYRFVILEAKARGIPDTQIFLSLERRMKCGVGKCGHCQINHLYVCQDGPVFKYSDIFYLKEAI